MRIRGTFRYMASSEIRLMMDPGLMTEIIRDRGDDHPLIKAFVVGHEGEAQGFLVGVGNIVKKWYRSAIEKLFTKINVGLRLFHGHAETNDQTGRTAIGEVVGKKLMTIDNNLSTIIACYIYPKFRHLPLDVASIEANIDFEEGRNGLIVVNVNDVSGIALANKAVETPGFPGASLLGQLQAFAKNKHLEVREMVSIEEVRQFLRDEKVKPSDVFGESDLTSDPIVIGYAKAAGKEAQGGEWRRRVEAQEELAALKKKHDEEIKARDEKIRTLSQDATKGKIPTIFEKKAADRKFDEIQKKFILARLPKFTPPVDEKDLESALDKHLDAELDEYSKIRKDVFGIEDKGDGKKKTGAEPEEGETSGDVAPENKFYDPANSPLK